MKDLWVNIDYDLIGNEFWYNTNIKGEYLLEFLEEYIRSKMGTGKDKSRVEKHDLYSIDIYLDLGGDIFSAKSNCGNRSLREGIVIGLVERLRKEDN